MYAYGQECQQLLQGSACRPSLTYTCYEASLCPFTTSDPMSGLLNLWHAIARAGHQEEDCIARDWVRPGLAQLWPDEMVCIFFEYAIDDYEQAA